MTSEKRDDNPYRICNDDHIDFPQAVLPTHLTKAWIIFTNSAIQGHVFTEDVNCLV